MNLFEEMLPLQGGTAVEQGAQFSIRAVASSGGFGERDVPVAMVGSVGGRVAGVIPEVDLPRSGTNLEVQAFGKVIGLEKDAVEIVPEEFVTTVKAGGGDKNGGRNPLLLQRAAG